MLSCHKRPDGWSGGSPFGWSLCPQPINVGCGHMTCFGQRDEDRRGFLPKSQEAPRFYLLLVLPPHCEKAVGPRRWETDGTDMRTTYSLVLSGPAGPPEIMTWSGSIRKVFCRKKCLSWKLKDEEEFTSSREEGEMVGRASAKVLWQVGGNVSHTNEAGEGMGLRWVQDQTRKMR